MTRKEKKNKVVGVILAAGVSRRMGIKKPKQFIKIKGKEIFIYTLQQLIKCPLLDSIIIVTHPHSVSKVKKSSLKYFDQINIDVIAGGKTRKGSVKKALDFFDNKLKKPAYILFHDAARPFVDKEITTKVIKNAFRYGAAIAGIRGTDLSASINNKIVVSVLDNKNSVLTQTPECFSFKLLLNIHKRAAKKIALRNATNLELMLTYNKPIRFVKFSERNLKITYSSDIKLAKSLLKYLHDKKDEQQRNR
jgi:2-C-methyl-D-erythritol 4-phosphate cytidylyltransferase